MFKVQRGYDGMVTKTFRLPEELVKKLLSIAGKNELSLNKLVTQCLEYAVENIDKNDLPDEMREKSEEN